MCSPLLASCARRRVFVCREQALPTDICERTPALPARVRTAVVLDAVNDRLEFEDPTHQATWTATFESNASHTLMADSFWWMFANLFKNDSSKVISFAKECMFFRMSENYVKLFLSVAPSLKDMIFENYYDALAQAIYYAMRIQFVDSAAEVCADVVKHRIVELTALWTMGCAPPSLLCVHWRLSAELAKPTAAGSETGDVSSQSTSQMLFPQCEFSETTAQHRTDARRSKTAIGHRRSENFLKRTDDSDQCTSNAGSRASAMRLRSRVSSPSNRIRGRGRPTTTVPRHRRKSTYASEETIVLTRTELMRQESRVWSKKPPTTHQRTPQPRPHSVPLLSRPREPTAAHFRASGVDPRKSEFVPTRVQRKVVCLAQSQFVQYFLDSKGVGGTACEHSVRLRVTRIRNTCNAADILPHLRKVALNQKHSNRVSRAKLDAARRALKRRAVRTARVLEEKHTARQKQARAAFARYDTRKKLANDLVRGFLG